jgi:hypothetical protein
VKTEAEERALLERLRKSLPEDGAVSAAGVVSIYHAMREETPVPEVAAILTLATIISISKD